MTDRSVSAGAVTQSVVVTGDGNTVSLVFGDSGVRLLLIRRQIQPPDRRRPVAAGEHGRELDILDPNRSPVPLVGRKPLLDELAAWVTDDDADISVHALTGRAGTGKTRLAIELCRRLDPEQKVGGQVAAFLSASELPSVVETLATRDFDWKRPTLLVIDYAAQAHKALARWLDRIAQQKLSTKLRFLLLEREAPEGFGWWQELTGSSLHSAASRQDLFRDPTLRPQMLHGLEAIEDRRRVVAAALSAVAKMRQTDPPEPIPNAGAVPAFDERLADPQFGNPLSLVMAGVLAIDQGARRSLALRRLDAARRLAERELERFEQMAGTAKAGAAAHLMAFNGLAGGLPLKDLRQTLAAELAEAGITGDAGEIAGLLEQELAPATGGSNGEVTLRLGTAQPDLVGEGVIIEALLGRTRAIAASAPALVRRAYAQTVGRAADALMKLLQDYAYAIEDATATEAEKATAEHLIEWLTSLAKATNDPETLEPLVAALPVQTTVLREQAFALTDRLASAFRDRLENTEADAPRAAVWIGNLAHRLSDLGRREEALTAAEEAVEIRRDLAAARPDAFRPDLAMSLNNFAVFLSDLGRREEALTAAEEAAGLYRDLAAARPDAFRPHLAMSLNNLGGRLSDLGRREEALTAAEEAVEIRRDLAATRPDAFRPDLAMSLNNFASFLSDLGRREDALTAAEEAAGLYRDLAAARPDAFRPNLAASLSNLGNRLSALGRREDALAAAEEAAGLDRDLAAARPDAFRPNLAASLGNLASRLSALGRPEEALTTAEEAAGLYRDLAAARPDAFRPNLAASLSNLANRLSALDRREEALTAAEEAAGLYRDLAAARPDAFAADLSVSLGALADVRQSNGDSSGAHDSIREAIEVLQPTFLATPPAVAKWMIMHVKRYTELGKALDRPPDMELIRPIIEVFQSMKNAGDGNNG